MKIAISKAYDLSKVQPGDVLFIRWGMAIKLGRRGCILLMRQMQLALERHNIRCEIRQDDERAGMEVKIL